jgi:SAM-dependent methyltransferase
VRHPFDLEFGVRTSGLIPGRHLGSGHRHDRYATAYYAIAPSVFRETISRWRGLNPPAPLNAYTFVDLGAGMGRALLLASEFPFRAVVGVEFNPALARIAARNLTLWRKSGRARTPLRILCSEAADVDPPPAGPCLLFLFNPFGAPVLRRVLAGWSRAFSGRGGQLDIVYVNNEQERVFAAFPGFRRLFAGRIRRSRADALADRRIITSQPDGEYAAIPWEDCSIHRWTGMV